MTAEKFHFDKLILDLITTHPLQHYNLCWYIYEINFWNKSDNIFSIKILTANLSFKEAPKENR